MFAAWLESVQPLRSARRAHVAADRRRGRRVVEPFAGAVGVDDRDRRGRGQRRRREEERGGEGPAPAAHRGSVARPVGRQRVDSEPSGFRRETTA